MMGTFRQDIDRPCLQLKPAPHKAILYIYRQIYIYIYIPSFGDFPMEGIPPSIRLYVYTNWLKPLVYNALSHLYLSIPLLNDKVVQ